MDRHALDMEYLRRRGEIDAWAASAVSCIAECVGGLDAYQRDRVRMEVFAIWRRSKLDNYSPMPSPLTRFKARQHEFSEIDE